MSGQSSKNPFPGRRGQISAPIELFVAVIIMTLSIALSLYIWDVFQKIQCSYRIKSQNENLQEAMQEVALGSSQTSKTVEYVMERCPGSPVEAIRFVHFGADDSKYCRRCPGNYGGCWIIEPLTYDPRNGLLTGLSDASVCVELSESISLNPVSGTAECSIDLSSMPCPPTLDGSPVDTAKCASLVKGDISQNVWSPAGGSGEWTTFARTAAYSSVYKIRITKQTTAGGATGGRGQLDLCVSQNA